MFDRFEPPRYITIILAAVITVRLILALWYADSSVKSLGSILLFLPTQLGLVQRATPAEVQALTLSSGPQEMVFLKPGHYAGYVNHFDGEFFIGNEHKRALLRIRSTASDTPVAINVTEHGVRLYDVPFMVGRPRLHFVIPAAGHYTLDTLAREVSLSFIPDYITPNEGMLQLTCVVQVGLIVLGFVLFRITRRRKSREHVGNRAGAQAERQAKAEAFWQAASRQRQTKDG